jgi:hypothetical protein
VLETDPGLAAPAPPDGDDPLWDRVRFPVLAFAVVAAALLVDVWLSESLLSRVLAYPVPYERFPGSGVLEGWFRFDGGWYRLIARDGYYSLGPDAQSPVAFFPAYPMAMRLVGVVTRDVVLAGIVVTALSGLAMVTFLYRWAVGRVGVAVARTTVLLVVVYPYAYYLFGAVYADAFFLAAAVGAFLLLERGHPILAGLAGALATAARPVGVAVLIGLVLVTIHRRGGFRQAWSRMRPADAGVLLAGGGLAAWCAYLWVRFGDPLLWDQVQGAPGWDQGFGPDTWIKRVFWARLPDVPGWLRDSVGSWSFPTEAGSSWIHLVYTLGLVLQAGLLLLALALLPRVFRRLGWGYGTYALIVLAIPLVGSKDFQGVGRYALAAFPCFVVGAELLVDRPRLRWCWLGASGALLLLLASGYAQGYYIA